MLGKPLVRSDDIVIQEAGDELLIYDLKINKAHSLNKTSAAVWKLCNGRNRVSEIANKMARQMKQPVSEDLVWIALDQFRKDGLLHDAEMVVQHFESVSRRSMLKRVGFASVIALPLISSIAAPSSVSAQSGCVSGLCVMALVNLCTICTGSTPYTQFTSTDGSCSGPVIATGSFFCVTGISFPNDVRIN